MQFCLLFCMAQHVDCEAKEKVWTNGVLQQETENVWTQDVEICIHNREDV